MNVEKICLLDIAPPQAGEVQRRVIEVEIEGQRAWREFDIVRLFDDQEEAGQYAQDNGIQDVVF